MKRILGFLLLTAMLLGCIPVGSTAAAASSAPTPDDYAALYVERGLVSLFTAFKGDTTVDTLNGTWRDRKSGTNATLGGKWRLNVKGGFGFDLAGDALSDTSHYIDFGISRLPSANYTIEYAARYKAYTTTPTHSGAYYANQLGDEIGTLKQFSVLAGVIDKVSAPVVRWYINDGGWDSVGSVNRFAMNDTSRASRALAVYGVTRTESQKSAGDGSGNVLHAAFSLYHNGVNTAVSTGTDAWRGTLNCSDDAKVNGTKIYFKEDANDKFVLFKGTPVDVYSVRIYNVVLTESEMAQNRGADIMAVHGFSLTSLLALETEQRALALGKIGELAMETATESAVESIIAAFAPDDTPPAENEYAKLYVTRGLKALYTAFKGDDSVKIAQGVWKDRVGGKSIAIKGAWTLGANGGLGYSLKGDAISDVSHYIDLGISSLPSADYTVEYAAKYKNYSTTPALTGAYYANHVGDEIGTLKQFTLLAGTLDGVAAPMVRWYVSHLSWNEGTVKGSSNRFAFNDVTRAERVMALYSITRTESEKNAADGSGKVLHASFALYYNGENAASVSGAESGRGVLNCSVDGKINGTKHYFKETADSKFILFKGTPVDVYAIRIYNVALTEGEILQNRGVDILAAYQFSLYSLKALGAEQRTLALQTIGALPVSEITAANVERIIIESVPKEVPKTEYDLLYVKEGLVGLYTAFGNDASVNLSSATLGKWQNKMDASETARLHSGNTWWKKGENGGIGYTMSLSDWQAHAKKVSISLPDYYATFPSFTVETVATVKGITNSDGTRYFNQYFPAEGNTPASGARYGYYCNTFSTFRFGALCGMYFVALHQSGTDGTTTGDTSFSARWMFGQTGYAAHNFNSDYAYRPANPTGIFIAFGNEAALRDKSMFIPTLDLLSFSKTASGIGTASESYRYEIAYNGKTALETTLTALQFEVMSTGAKNNEGASDFTLFGAAPSHVYAIRVYDRPLLESEKAQNHFADIAAYYQLDLTEYYKLSDTAKTQMHNVFATLELEGQDKTMLETLLTPAEATPVLLEKTISFKELRPVLMERAGLRAIFSVDTDTVRILEAMGYTVSYGAAVAVGSYGETALNTLDSLTVKLENGTVVTDAPNACVLLVKGEGGSGKYFDLMGDETLYSAALTFGEDAEYAVGMLVRGFVTLSDAEGNEMIHYVDLAGDLTGEISMIDAADYFVNRYEGPIGTAYAYLSAPALRHVLALVGKEARASLPEELTLYVDAEKGSDGNSGTDAGAPLATLSAAYTAAKAHLANQNAKGVTVRLGAGRYYVDKPLVLNGEDIAAENYYFNIIGSGKDTVITAGKVIDTSSLTTDPDTGFKKLSLPKYVGAYPDFRNLSLNGEPLSLAHHGSSDECFTIYGEMVNDEKHTAMLYVDAADLPYGFEGRGAEMHLPVEWWFCVVHIDYIDWANQFTRNGRELVPVYMNYNEYSAKVVNSGHSALNRSFWIENSYELLDANENTYYYDQKTGTVYINEGTSLVAGGLLEYAGSEQLLIFENVENITVEGVTLTGTDNRIVHEGQGISAGQSAAVYTMNAATGERVNLTYLTASAIRGKNVKGFTVRNTVFTAIGGNGMMLDGVTENLTVESSRFSHIGVTALHVGNASYHSSKAYAKNILIRNNEFTHIGELVSSANAIYIPVVANLQILENTFRYIRYSAIALGRHWSASEYTLEQIAQDNVFRVYNAEVAYNHISDFMTCMRDGGAIYTTGGSAERSEATPLNFVHDNYIVFTEETGKHLHEGEETRHVMGIYHDGSSSQWYDTNNVLIYQGGEHQGKIIPLYVQQIQRPASDQRAFQITLYENYAIGFKDEKGNCSPLALYGLEERMDAERFIYASDFIFESVEALASDEFLLDAVLGSATSAYHNGGALSCVAAILENAGADLGGVEKISGGVDSAPDESVDKKYSIMGEWTDGDLFASLDIPALPTLPGAGEPGDTVGGGNGGVGAVVFIVLGSLLGAAALGTGGFFLIRFLRRKKQ